MENCKTDNEIRENTKTTFVKMLAHLGRKEFAECQRYLADDVVCDWPYLPIPDMSNTMKGSADILKFFEAGMSTFDPYAYEIDAIHDMVDPEMLIAEYRSNSFYHPRNCQYANRYLSLVRVKNGKVTYWREYVNPLIIKEVMAF